VPFKLIHLSKTINEIFQRCATLDKNSTDAVRCLVLLWYQSFFCTWDDVTRWPDYRVRTIHSKVNKGQLSNFTSRGLADPDDDVVSTMQRRCCLHHVAILWTSSAQHDNVISTARRRRTRKPTMSCRAEVFRCMTLHKIFCIWAGIAYKIGLVRHSSNSPMTNMHVCDGNELTPLGLGRGTKTSKLDAPGNAGWLATPAVICMTETGLYNLQMA